MGANYDVYYRTALAATLMSASCVVALMIAVPLIYTRASFERDQILMKSDHFRVSHLVICMISCL